MIDVDIPLVNVYNKRWTYPPCYWREISPFRLRHGFNSYAANLPEGTTFSLGWLSLHVSNETHPTELMTCTFRTRTFRTCTFRNYYIHLLPISSNVWWNWEWSNLLGLLQSFWKTASAIFGIFPKLFGIWLRAEDARQLIHVSFGNHTSHFAWRE